MFTWSHIVWSGESRWEKTLQEMMQISYNAVEQRHVSCHTQLRESGRSLRVESCPGSFPKETFKAVPLIGIGESPPGGGCVQEFG